MPVRKIEALAVGTVAVIMAIALFASAFELPSSVPQAVSGGRLSVVTTLFPLYDFSRQIGGDRADVTLLLPPGVEPHSFDPRPSDILKINRAGVFAYTGEFMEPWAAGLAASLPASVRVVDASDGIALNQAASRGAGEPEGPADPHIWMDFANDRQITENIAAAMSAADPANADYYRANADAYKLKLTELDARFGVGLANCRSREIIYGGHYTLGYLASRYGLEHSSAQGIAPDAEPTAKDLAAMVSQIRKEGIKYVFYEELESPKIAETLAAETEAHLVPMNSAHNLSRQDLREGITFIDMMETNLANLKTGLQCRDQQ